MRKGGGPCDEVLAVLYLPYRIQYLAIASFIISDIDISTGEEVHVK
jgi:hypothetical protein